MLSCCVVLIQREDIIVKSMLTDDILPLFYHTSKTWIEAWTVCMETNFCALLHKMKSIFFSVVQLILETSIVLQLR